MTFREPSTPSRTGSSTPAWPEPESRRTGVRQRNPEGQMQTVLALAGPLGARYESTKGWRSSQNIWLSGVTAPDGSRIFPWATE
jgi:hypothetical protein